MQYNEQTRQQMFAMIASWKQSGVSQKEYCEQITSAQHSFAPICLKKE